MQRQSSHAGRGVEGLSHRDENAPAASSRSTSFAKSERERVSRSTCRPRSGRRDLRRCRRASAAGPGAPGFLPRARVLVDGWQQHPALRFLARDIRGAGFSLRIEGVELLLKTFFRTLSRIDGATDFLHVRPCAWASDRKSVVLTSGCR